MPRLMERLSQMKFSPVVMHLDVDYRASCGIDLDQEWLRQVPGLVITNV
jgi:hypothetical protein